MCLLLGSLGLQKHWEANLRKALLLRSEKLHRVEVFCLELLKRVGAQGVFYSFLLPNTDHDQRFVPKIFSPLA